MRLPHWVKLDMERAKLGETDMLVSRLSFGGPFEEPFGCALAWPASVFYDQPMLLALLPVAGLNIIIASFNVFLSHQFSTIHPGFCR